MSPTDPATTDFQVFERADGALVLVPMLFQLPQALEAEGPLRAIGAVQLPLTALSRELVEGMALRFYGVACGADAQLLRNLLGRPKAVSLAT